MLMVTLIFCSNAPNWPFYGARCVPSNTFGPKSAPKTFWGKIVKGHHHGGRLTPYHEGDCPHYEGRPRNITNCNECPSWWGEAPLLKYLTKILIFGHYLTPQKREISSHSISNQKNLTETKKTYVIFSGAVPLMMNPSYE